jgi:hypothetical protein
MKTAEVEAEVKRRNERLKRRYGRRSALRRGSS